MSARTPRAVKDEDTKEEEEEDEDKKGDENQEEDEDEDDEDKEPPGCCARLCPSLCSKSEEEPVDEEEIDLPTHIRVFFSQRSFVNKLLYLLYKFFRFNFVAVWFYFVPFFAMILSYLLPWYLRRYHPLSEAEMDALNAADDADGN